MTASVPPPQPHESRSEEALELLARRARLLARPAATDGGERLHAVRFTLAGEQYAVESAWVREVFRLQDLSPLPGAAAPLFGVTVWRGRLLPVLDLRGPLGLAPAALNDLGQVIVLDDDRDVVGFLADSVVGTLRVASSAVRAPPEGVAVNREFLRGITDDAVLVLEGRALLRQIHRRSAIRELSPAQQENTS